MQYFLRSLHHDIFKLALYPSSKGQQDQVTNSETLTWTTIIFASLRDFVVKAIETISFNPHKADYAES